MYQKDKILKNITQAKIKEKIIVVDTLMVNMFRKDKFLKIYTIQIVKY